MQLSQEAINSMWTENSVPAQKLRAAGNESPEAFTAELDRQVRAVVEETEEQERLAVILRKQFEGLRLRYPKLQMAVRMGCRQMGVEAWEKRNGKL